MDKLHDRSDSEIENNYECHGEGFFKRNPNTSRTYSLSSSFFYMN
jgi:hypothetical protein